MVQRVKSKFCVKLGKTPTETYEMLQTVYADEASGRSRIFRMIQEAGVLQPLEMQTQSQMSAKC
jgi:hypothetical protein